MKQLRTLALSATACIAATPITTGEGATATLDTRAGYSAPCIQPGTATITVHNVSQTPSLPQNGQIQRVQIQDDDGLFSPADSIGNAMYDANTDSATIMLTNLNGTLYGPNGNPATGGDDLDGCVELEARILVHSILHSVTPSSWEIGINVGGKKHELGGSISGGSTTSRPVHHWAWKEVPLNFGPPGAGDNVVCPCD